MFLGYQIDQNGNEVIVSAKENIEDFNPCINYTKIVKSEEKYKLVDGKYITIQESFEKAKIKKRNEINKCRNEAEQGGFKYLGKTFDSDPISCIRIQGASQMAAQLPQKTEPIITWTCQDNTTIILTVEELVGLSNALVAWSNECHQKATRLKELIDLAGTEEELDLIVW